MTRAQRIEKAALAVLRQADKRSESNHPMAYILPWRQLTALRRALAVPSGVGIK